MFGGQIGDVASDSDEVLDDLWRLDFAAEAWTQVRYTGYYPGRRKGAQLIVASETEMVLLGGFQNAYEEAAVDEEGVNTPFCPLQEKFYPFVLRGLRNISEAPSNPPMNFLLPIYICPIFRLLSGGGGRRPEEVPQQQQAAGLPRAGTRRPLRVPALAQEGARAHAAGRAGLRRRGGAVHAAAHRVPAAAPAGRLLHEPAAASRVPAQPGEGRVVH